MPRETSVRRESVDFIRRLLITLPLLSLALGAASWLRYGMDIPWIDDWRGYVERTIDSLDPAYLFSATNDTMSPVGKALDASAQRLLDGNSVAYQLVTMLTVLGSLLLLQWKLLEHAVGPSRAAVCFVLTLLMLQPGSYWGLENLAYQQGLPLVFILWALLLVSRRTVVTAVRGPTIALLCLMAGFTYISGAFAALAAGLGMLAVAVLCHVGVPRRQLTRDAAWVISSSAVAVAVQFYFSIIQLRATSPRLALAMPTEPQFWAYYLGKIARSLLLPQEWPRSSLVAAALVCSVALACAFVFLRRAAQAGNEEEKRLAAIYVPLAAAVAVYLALVAAGRTHFRPIEMQGLLEIFTLGFPRFHFFWATLLWPWVAASLIVLWSRSAWFPYGRSHWEAGFACALAVLLLAAGALDHMKSQRELGLGRERVAHCLLQELQKGGQIRCEGLLAPRFHLDGMRVVITERAPDAYPAYAYARQIGASFVRHFPVLTSTRRSETIPAFFVVDGDAAAARLHEMQPLGNGSFRAVGTDPQLHLHIEPPRAMRECAVLDVDLEMKGARRDTAQLYFLRFGRPKEYSEADSVKVPMGARPGSFETVRFRAESRSGFFESLRIDPVTSAQQLEIREIRLYCVWPLPN